MYCTKCGAQCAPGTKFCTACGTPVVQPVSEPVAAPEQTPVVPAPAPVTAPAAAPVATAEPAPVASPAEVPEKVPATKFDFNIVKIQLFGIFTPWIDKIKPYLTNKKVWICAAAAIVLLVAVSIISNVIANDNGFIDYKQNIRFVDNGGEINVIVDDKVLSDSAMGEYSDNIRVSIDGKVAAFINDEDELYVVNGKKLKKVADDVSFFELSSSGEGLAYAVYEGEHYALTLYSVKNKKSKTVSTEVSNLDFSLSPDGKSVAYYVEGDDADNLMFFKGSKSLTISSSYSDLVGLTNNGKHIYAICQNDDGETQLYAFDKDGDRQKLGNINSTSVKFNADHTQIMFYNDGKTYIAAKGKDAVKVSSNSLYLVTAPNSQSASDNNSITYPVDSLYNHVYTCSDGENTSAWLIKKNVDKSEKLVSRVSSCTLDASAKYLYYIYNYGELRVVKISDGDKAADRYKTIAKDVHNYVVTSDRERVYFLANGYLCCTNGEKGGRARIIANDNLDYILAINGKDVVYYVMDGDLYACDNGKKGKRVVSDAELVYHTANGLVYAQNDDSIYVTSGSKKLDDILDLG